MPTYEFACPHGHEFEKFYKMSEAPAAAPCPQCGESATRRISGGAGLVFKGSGFYLTDYGKNAHRSSGDAPKKGGDESKGGDTKSGDTKSGDAKGGDAKGGEPKASGAPAKPDAARGGETKASSKPSAPKKGE